MQIEKIEAAGEITKLPGGAGVSEKKIFIEDTGAQNSASKGYDKANVLIGNETKIYKGYTDQELTVDDLQKGERVEIVFTDDPRLMIYPVTAKAETIRRMEPGDSALVYENRQYKFALSLPETWQGFQVVTEEWEGLGRNGKTVETGPVIKFRIRSGRTATRDRISRSWSLPLPNGKNAAGEVSCRRCAGGPRNSGGTLNMSFPSRPVITLLFPPAMRKWRRL